jgi:hypothetical protein
MVSTTLNEKLIKDGEQIITQLLDSKICVDAALWFYSSDFGDYRLLLSLPEIIKQGPLAAYKKVQSAISDISKRGVQLSLSLDQVQVVEPNSPTLKLLRTALKTSPKISGIRLTNSYIDRQIIEDVFIYFLTLKKTLSWPAVPGATGYDLQIADNPNFVNPIDSQTNLPTNFWTLTKTLENHKVYYWRVRVVNSNTGVVGDWICNTFTMK